MQLKRMQRSAIFLAVNRRLLPMLRVCLASLARNYPDYPEVLVYHPDFTSDEIAALEKYPRLRTRQIALDQIPSGPAMEGRSNSKLLDSRMTYVRLLLWTPEFAGYNQILHLDCDTLILGSLDELFTTPGFLIARDEDPRTTRLFLDDQSRCLEQWLDEDGLRPVTTAGNAGVFVTTEQERTGEDFRWLTRTLNRYRPHLRWADQSLINLWMQHRHLTPTLSARYNRQYLAGRPLPHEGTLRECAILHINTVHHRYRLALLKAGHCLGRSRIGWALWCGLHAAAVAATAAAAQTKGVRELLKQSRS